MEEEKTSKTPSKLIPIKQFYTEAEASVYVAKLQDSGIRSLLQNETAYTVLPVGEQGIRLFVLEEDVELAQDIIYQMDTNMRTEPDESFHDADHEDIEYQRKLKMGNSNNRLILIAIIITILLLAYVYYLGTSGQTIR
ncbi:MAG: DUF2007 domain-containing protein [Bacteroidia bacterium]|nr:DUF2007 domain-containing protein [Bacteroidia bacterium]